MMMNNSNPSPRPVSFLNAVHSGNHRKISKMLSDSSIWEKEANMRHYLAQGLSIALEQGNKALVEIFLKSPIAVSGYHFRLILKKGEPWSDIQEKAWKIFEKKPHSQFETKQLLEIFQFAPDIPTLEKIISWGFGFDKSGSDGLILKLLKSSEVDFDFFKKALELGFNPGPDVFLKSNHIFNVGFQRDDQIKAIQWLIEGEHLCALNLSVVSYPGNLEGLISLLTWAQKKEDPVSKYWNFESPIKIPIPMTNEQQFSPLEYFLLSLNSNLKSIFENPHFDSQLDHVLQLFEKDGFHMENKTSLGLQKRRKISDKTLKDWVKEDLTNLIPIFERKKLRENLPMPDLLLTKQSKKNRKI